MTNNDMQVIIGFYKKFDRYKENTNEDLYQHVLPSFQLKQYKIHKDGENVIAFTNWAFLNKEAENRYVKTAELNPEDWNSGNQPWHIDTLCIGNILKVHRWTKKYFTDLLGANKTVSWLRVLANGKIKRQTRTLTKKIWVQ
tara:strand:+ start:82 stop:504 length:423 start_codon:yes stop_codon:yes gene_type:complete